MPRIAERAGVHRAQAALPAVAAREYFYDEAVSLYG